jgi:hypothetical protein
MGARIDQLGPGAALQLIAGLGIVLAIVFSGIYAYFAARGGYRRVLIVEARSSAP